jgi:hypothetical protein
VLKKRPDIGVPGGRPPGRGWVFSGHQGFSLCGGKMLASRDKISMLRPETASFALPDVILCRFGPKYRENQL